MKKEWSTGQKTAVILGSICAGLLLLTVFCIDVFRLARYLFYVDADDYPTARYRQEEPGTYPESDSNDFQGGGYGDFDDGSGGDYRYFDGDDFYDDYGYYGDDGTDSGEYYEFHDAIRNDLSYRVDFEYYGEVFGEDNVELSMAYPIVYSADGSIDLDGVNNVIQREVGEVKAYTASVGEELSADVAFRFDVDSYVTYMDEEILSIIYVESGYLDGESYENYVISVNVDMESGLAMTNSQILDIDDEFSIDFRNRSEKQNGDVGGISMFSDQDITDMLNDDDSLIIFYTPLGMEVGFNYYYGWVTVTYKDYQKYKSLF